MRVTVRILLSCLLGLSVLAVSGIVSSIDILAGLKKSYPWLPVTHTVMLISSFILIWLLSKGEILRYGLKTIEIRKLKQPLLVGSIAGIILTGLGALLPLKGFETVGEFSLVQIVIFVWLYASISEEFLTRGLVQGFLSPLIKYRIKISKFHISLPILVSALFFGAMHLGLLAMNEDKFTVFIVVLLATFLGIIAGYFREVTGSIIPAVVVHMLFNIWGTVIGAIEKLIIK
jgi:membrane protease YdiL (CAAX protease family)